MKADFLNEPERMKQFGDRRWIGIEDPTLLDYERCELLLIGARSGAEELEGALSSYPYIDPISSSI
jgi:hypothetical protein